MPFFFLKQEHNSRIRRNRLVQTGKSGLTGQSVCDIITPKSGNGGTDMTRTVILNGRECRYELQRKKVKNVNLRIRADGSISVSASRSVPEEKIEEFLLEKADFILRALDRFETERKKIPPPARYEEGEHFPLFGQNLTLHLLKGTKNSAVQDGTVLILTVTEPENFELKKRTLEHYADRKCKETVTEICETVYPLFAARGVLYPELRFRRMTSRWGSCRPKAGILHLQQTACRLSHSLHRIRSHARIYAFSPARPFGALLGRTCGLHAGLESAQTGA